MTFGILRRSPLRLLSAALLLAACSPVDAIVVTPGTGGALTGAGGADSSSSGGVIVSAGGSPVAGGAPASGGVPSAGGSPSAGGAPLGDGGAAAAGGSSAGGGGGGSGGSGTPPLPPEAIIFQEDFESTADDAVPADWDSFVSYVVNMNNTPGGSAFALADSSKAHAGTKALHVKGGSSPAMLTRPLPQGTTAIYMRSYVWLTNKLGANPGNNHETLIGVRGGPGGANDEVRFGEIKGVLGTNEVPSDDISPLMEQWGMGPEIAAGTWNCVEVAFLGDADKHEVRAWNNGTEVHVVNDPSQWQNKTATATFLNNKFKEFIIGWHSFSNYDNEIWFDDIVVAKQRVGCN